MTNLAYAVGYDEQHHGPAYVVYHLSHFKKSEHPDKRPKKFESDPRLRFQIFSSDFTNSGYERGHMAANEAIDACFVPLAQKETFVTSNILPQPGNLNQVTWRNIEVLEEKLAADETWGIDGAVYGSNPKTIGRNKVAVPNYCYKIDIFVRDGCIKEIAFEVPENCPPTKEISQYVVTINKLENDTHLNFFADLPDALESALERRAPAEAWRDAQSK